MSSSPLEGFPQVFALRSGQGAIVLHQSGLRHPRFPRWTGETFTRWGDVTHHTVTSRAFRLATRRSVYVFPRSLFADATAPDELARALVEHIGRQPGGREQLERMWQVEKLAARPLPARASALFAALCALVFALDALVGGQRVFFAGFFNALLVRDGELWRVVTANLLHGGAAHLLLNGLGLLGLGALVERVLGPARTTLVLGAGALGGMGAGLAADYEMAVGASGVVFGLVGALVWLELRWARRLPAGWRVPRTLLLGALAGDGLLSLVVPEIAAAAHAGGFAAGALACGALAGPALETRAPRPWVRAADAALLLVLGASLGSAGALVLHEGSPVAEYARRLADRADVPALTLNNFAWLIATDPRATPDDRELAVRLAERAVEGTARRDPNVLDTLAEAWFAAGSPAEAVRTIDEAIALAPGEDYFREQRRRFTGERAPDDRPEPPGVWIGPLPEAPPRRPPARPEPDEGVRV